MFQVSMPMVFGVFLVSIIGVIYTYRTPFISDNPYKWAENTLVSLDFFFTPDSSIFGGVDQLKVEVRRHLLSIFSFFLMAPDHK